MMEYRGNMSAMSEADRKRILDRRIQRRLATDLAYRNAENAEGQARREREIELQEDTRLTLEQGHALLAVLGRRKTER